MMSSSGNLKWKSVEMDFKYSVGIGRRSNAKQSGVPNFIHCQTTQARIPLRKKTNTGGPVNVQAYRELCIVKQYAHRETHT